MWEGQRHRKSEVFERFKVDLSSDMFYHKLRSAHRGTFCADQAHQYLGSGGDCGHVKNRLRHFPDLETSLYCVQETCKIPLTKYCPMSLLYLICCIRRDVQSLLATAMYLVQFSCMYLLTPSLHILCDQAKNLCNAGSSPVAI